MYNFKIKKDAKGGYRAYFSYNSDTLFWTEGFTFKAGAKNAIDVLKKNAPGAPVEDDTSLDVT